MSITKKEVQHIAELARIELPPEEEQKFEKELSAILEFVEKLNEVDTDEVKPLSGGTNLKNITREDDIMDGTLENKAAALVHAAPDRKNAFIKVKGVFDR